MSHTVARRQQFTMKKNFSEIQIKITKQISIDNVYTNADDIYSPCFKNAECKLQISSLSANKAKESNNVHPTASCSLLNLPMRATSYKGAALFKQQIKLGEGAVGEVWRVMHKQTNELYALKQVSKISANMVSNHILSSC